MILVDQIKNLDFFCLWQLFRPSIKVLLHPSERLRIRAKNVIAPPCLKYALHNQSHLFKLSKVSNKRTGAFFKFLVFFPSIHSYSIWVVYNFWHSKYILCLLLIKAVFSFAFFIIHTMPIAYKSSNFICFFFIHRVRIH